jgi:hypothetical protein
MKSPFGRWWKVPSEALTTGLKFWRDRRFTMKMALPTLIAAVAVAGVAFTTPADTMEGHTIGPAAGHQVGAGTRHAPARSGGGALARRSGQGRRVCAPAQVSRWLSRCSAYASGRRSSR